MEKQKISISTKYQFEKIIDKKEIDNFRSVIRVEQDKIIVTDGHILFCAEHLQEENFIPVNVNPIDLAYERKKAGKQAESVLIDTSDNQIYPDYRCVIPNLKDCQHHTFTINVSILIKALQMFGDVEGVQFHLGKRSDRAFLLSSCEKKDCFALVMPMKNISNDQAAYIKKFEGTGSEPAEIEPAEIESAEIEEERFCLERIQEKVKRNIELNKKISSGAGGKRFRRNKKQMQKENVWYEVKNKIFME